MAGAIAQVRSRLATAEAVGIAVLATAMFAAVLVGFSRVSPSILHYSTWDFWFESDPPAVADELLNRLSRNHLRTSHHPLFSILLFPLVQLLSRLPGATPEVIFGLLLSTVGATWIALAFVTLRFVGLRRVDAGVFSVLAATSASVVFWFPVLEASAFGALSIMLAIALVALTERGRTVPLWACLLASVATIAFTSTNWMVGLLMLAAVLPWRKACVTAAASLGVTGALWGLQRVVFPTSGFPLELNTQQETGYLFNSEGLGLLQKSFAFFFHSIVLPEIGTVYGFRLSVQGMRPGAGSLLATAAVAVWFSLLVLGAWSIWQRRWSKTAAVLLLAMAGQWALALVFGIETFFYSAHFGPILVLLSAMSALTRGRGLAVALATALVFLGGANNISRFNGAAERVKERYEDERRFSAALVKLTDPSSLFLCGRHALAAVGEPAEPLAEILGAPPRNVLLTDDPDTCYYRFDGSESARNGWILPYERWSIEAIEGFRQAGARYFVTPYTFGIETSPNLFLWLDQRFRRLGDGLASRLYDLSEPALQKRALYDRNVPSGGVVNTEPDATQAPQRDSR